MAKASTSRHCPWLPAMVVLLTGVLMVPSAWGQEGPSASISYEGESTDNVRRSSDDTRDDFIHQPALNLGYRKSFNRAEIGTAYRLEARRYARDTFQSDEVITGRSDMDVALIPGRLQWLTDHVRSETLLDRRTVDRPDNRRESDTVGTGVTAQFGASGPNQFTARARTEHFRSNRGFDDSLRYLGSVAYQRRMSPVTTVGLTANASRIDFDDGRVPDFDRLTGQFTFDRQLRTLAVGGAIGYSDLRRDGQSNRGGLSLAADVSWEPATGHVFSLSGSREFTDRTQATNRGIAGFGDVRDQGTSDGEAFLQTLAEIGYRYSSERWTLNARAEVTDEDFDQSSSDQRNHELGLRLGFRLTRAVSLDLNVRGAERDFQDRTDEDFSADGRLNWRFGTRTTLRFGAGYERRDSDVMGRSFSQRRAFVGVTYRLL